MIAKGKVVVITGASSGIGLAIAEHLTAKGHHVFGLSRTTPANPKYSHIACDVTKAEQLDVAVAEITKVTGKVDVLINCAGIGIGGAIEETAEAAFDKIFAVNVKGVFLTTKVFLPLLRDGNQPKIINIGSVAGTLTIPFQAFYSMTKAAVASFSEALRMEVKPLGIGVCTILPGDTKTAFTANREKNETAPASPYGKRIERSLKRMEIDEQQGASPLSVAKVITRLLGKKKLPVQVTVGSVYKLFIFLHRLLPKRLVNWILYQMYGK